MNETRRGSAFLFLFFLVQTCAFCISASDKQSDREGGPTRNPVVLRPSQILSIPEVQGPFELLVRDHGKELGKEFISPREFKQTVLPQHTDQIETPVNSMQATI